jgi:hypothetical protein
MRSWSIRPSFSGQGQVSEPDLSEAELLALVTENTGVPARLIRVATGYWTAHLDEIDAEIAAADAAEESAGQRLGGAAGQGVLDAEAG